MAMQFYMSLENISLFYMGKRARVHFFVISKNEIPVVVACTFPNFLLFFYCGTQV